MVRIGILGAGFMGRTHLDAYLNIEKAKVIAVADRNLDKADALASKAGCKAMTDLEKLVRAREIDLVDIALPTPNHKRYAIQALEAGKHVIVEKPLALRLKDADEIIAVADRLDRFLMIAHVLRFWPEYSKIQEILTGGILGKPLEATTYRLAGPPHWATWFHDHNKSGGAPVDLQIHDLDVLNWYFGRPLSITSSGVRAKTGAWEHVTSLIKYPGVYANVESGYMFPRGFPFTSGIRILCEGGAIEYHFRAGGASFEQGQTVSYFFIYQDDRPGERVEIEVRNPFRCELAYFVDCVDSGIFPEILTPDDARLALQTSLASLESLELGVTVEI